MVLTLENVTVERNGSFPQGGGILAQDGAALVMRGTAEVTSARSGSEGGAGITLRNAAASRIADQARVSGNVTTGNGGAIFIDRSALTIEGAAIISGNAAGNGGGVALEGAGASLTMGGTASITGNSATSAGGGAWSAPGRTEIDTTLTSANVSGNTAVTCAACFHAETSACLAGGGGGSGSVTESYVSDSGNYRVAVWKQA